MIRYTPLKKLIAAAVVAAGGAVALDGCFTPHPESQGGRSGELMAIEELDDGGDGVSAYRLIYLTSPLTEGAPVEASGLLLVPDTVTSEVLTSYQHSSAVARDDVPTVAATPHRKAAEALARSGRLVVAADYLGLGASKGPHPWLDADSEATATADLLAAAPEAIVQLDRPVPKEVDLVGFSQGAHASMALARRLSTTPLPFAIRAIVAIAGPYRLDAVDVPALVNGGSDPMVRSLALARLVETAAALGHPVEDMFKPVARTVVRDLFDGTHSDIDVVTALPRDPSELFTNVGWTALTDPTSPFGQWLTRTSSVCSDWTTEAPVTLLHARGDTSALPANSLICRDQLAASGITVTLDDLGDVDHIPSGETGIQRAAVLLRQLDTAP